MLDRIFAPLLAFVLLIAGTAAVCAALFFTPRSETPMAPSAPPAVIVLEQVVITANKD